MASLNIFTHFLGSLTSRRRDRQALRDMLRQQALARLMEAVPVEASPTHPTAGEGMPRTVAGAHAEQQPSSTGETPLRAHLVSSTSSVGPGGTVSLTVATVSGAHCEIAVLFASGPSQARGLEPKIADASRQVTWTWSIGRQCRPQELVIRVVCKLGDQAASTEAKLRVRAGP